MRRAIRSLLCLLPLLLGTSLPAQAEKRVALVIGNGAYANASQLPNPRNDAEDVAAALKRSGFETMVGIDLDQAKMQEAAINFAHAARNADVALFYYSGHALQFAGVNYLMPVDAKLTDEADLRRMARVDDILADLQQAIGLHDMRGNVWEWVEDCWHDSYRGAPSNGSAWTTGDCRLRVLRGGSWGNRPRSLRSANRDRDSTDNRNSNYGLRLARTL